MAYIHGERNQVRLLPASIEEYIMADDPVRVYDVFVDQLDLDEIGITWDSDKVGAPEYDPRIMLKLWIYGYSYGIRSSRKLERAICHDLSFIWLAGGLKPDHKTLSRYRRANLTAMKNVLRQCARLCLKLGLIEGNTIFVDGTKIRGNVSLERSLSKADCERILQKADRRIEAIIAESEVQDQAEEDEVSLVRINGELIDLQKLKSVIQGALKELTESGRKLVNLTDPDCCHAGDKRSFMAGYNMQSVVDDKNGLIVQTEVVNKANDRNQFSRQIEQATEVLGKKCEVACGDAGYANTENLMNIEQQGIRVIVPSQDQAQHKPFGPFARDKFTYDAGRDCYICPEGEILSYRKTDNLNQLRVYQIGRASICRNCRFYGVCTRAKEGRAIAKILADVSKRRLEAEYAKPESQLIYRRRKARVEHPFGHIKHNLGVRYFILRGLRGVQAEASLLATSFNITRAIQLLGTPKLIKEWAII